MTASRSLLTRGLKFLRREHGTPFTVVGLNGVLFTGMREETRRSNRLGEGGFIPSLGSILYVEREEFGKVPFLPWLGMTIRLDAREFRVTEIGDNEYRWALTLEVAHPKEPSDVPRFFNVIGTSEGVPVEFTAGPISIT